MPIEIVGEEGTDGVQFGRLSGLVTGAEWQAWCQGALARFVGRTGIKLLVDVTGFEGFGPGGEWEDLGDFELLDLALAGIAVFGDARWRDDVLMFTMADLRRAPVCYFATEAEARSWLDTLG
jgi:hypothetical protein